MIIFSNELQVVSLFDGISCGRVALERAGIKIKRYAAFEIDKYAKSISRYNYPDITQHGDVLNADFSEFKGFDMVIGGSPCTFWSIAKTNREVDKNGIGWKLFMRFVEAVRVIRPCYFLYENVNSMPKSIKEYITEEFGVEPIMINSALVSAQQRKRLYWTNIPNVTQPADKGILLKDILETVCMVEPQTKIETKPIALANKSQTIVATLHKENVLSMLKRNKKGLFCAHEITEEVGCALRTREDEAGRFKRLEVRGDGKINSITTVLTDSAICQPVRVGAFNKGGQGDRIYSVYGKTVCISANGGGMGGKTGLYKVDLPDGDYIVRKLTPKEAERCQTLPDDYTAFGIDNKEKTVPISNTQRYKSVGNGWSVDTVSHILSHIF